MRTLSRRPAADTSAELAGARSDVTAELESGDLGPEFRQVTRTASFAEGVGVAGRTWQARDLVFVEDLGEVTDCVRAPAAQRAGVRSGVCLPIMIDGRVVGTMDFLAKRTLIMADSRRDALRNTAFLISQTIQRMRASERVATAARELVSSIDEVERNVAEATKVAGEGQQVAGRATDLVAHLGHSSAEIDKVVRVITGIAEQPTCSHSTRRSKLRGPGRRARASRSSPVRSRSWPGRPRRPPRRSAAG